MIRRNVIPFEELGIDDVALVGGKNASLGEMVNHLSGAGIRVPGGFATTATAFYEFLDYNGLTGEINAALDALNVDDVEVLSATGAAIRQRIMASALQPDLERDVVAAYERVCDVSGDSPSFAIRSSATAEDLPDASFAGQQETYLNVQGIENVLASILKVFASLYNDRAIAYRVHQGFEHRNVALSAGIQRMVRSDIGASGVMFTLDTESGFRDVVFINAAYGLGETVVQGAVNPDEFYVHKPTLDSGRPAILQRNLGAKAIKMVYTDRPDEEHPIETVDVDPAARRQFSITDAEVQELARYACAIEGHYGRPMDIEWGRDGDDGKLYILQARPETVKARAGAGTLTRYQLKTRSEALVNGRAIGQRIGSGSVRVIPGPADMHRVQPGDVLVTDMTDPDWEPVMKRAAAIVTNRGGRTCHAAIIARELGIPAVVGCGDATGALQDVADVTVSCAEGDTGYVYRGVLEIEVQETRIDRLGTPPTKIMLNVGNPERAFDFQFLPNAGVGLARQEFIVSRMIGIHPRAILDYPEVPEEVRDGIDERSAGYPDPASFYVQKLAEGISTLAAAFAPKPVIVRLSDFKSNEYSNLLGGDRYEPHEENPMLGFRGASRYIAPEFQACFEMECRALRFVRDDMGLTNIEVMVPFVRTLGEAREVTALLEKNGLVRGKNGLRVLMMCEIPSNVILADQFLEYFDGFSIGSNDLTQLTLGLDRDSGLVAQAFDERDPAMKALFAQAIAACRNAGKYAGICGQAPSDYPDLAAWLVEQGISSISLNPDTVVDTWMRLSK